MTRYVKIDLKILHFLTIISDNINSHESMWQQNIFNCFKANISGLNICSGIHLKNTLFWLLPWQRDIALGTTLTQFILTFFLLRFLKVKDTKVTSEDTILNILISIEYSNGDTNF